MQQLCTHRHDLDENGGEVVEVRVQNTLTIAKGHIVSRLAKDSDVAHEYTSTISNLIVHLKNFLNIAHLTNWVSFHMDLILMFYG